MHDQEGLRMIEPEDGDVLLLGFYIGCKRCGEITLHP
jgi:hypothetical protein